MFQVQIEQIYAVYASYVGLRVTKRSHEAHPAGQGQAAADLMSATAWRI